MDENKRSARYVDVVCLEHENQLTSSRNNPESDPKTPYHARQYADYFMSKKWRERDHEKNADRDEISKRQSFHPLSSRTNPSDDLFVVELSKAK